MWILALAWIAFMIIAPIWAVATVRRQRREIRALRERLDRLEARTAPGGETLAVVPPPVTPEAPAPLPAPIPLAGPPAAPREPPPAAPAPVPAGGFDTSRAEELIGSVWLQNVGAVLLLLGVFFLILWGYTTGRFGPGVLVAAGATLGAALAWRGDRMARSLPLFGHALIGVGIGTIYVSLYLGHFTLHALAASVAAPSLVLVSVGSVVVGLRYRVQTIAVLGVVGAFVPQLLAAWVPLRGFSMSPPGMLGYLAAVDAVVFLLAARAGWSGLDLATLFMSAVTWTAQFGHAPWSLPVQAGLTAVFVALGLSPVPRLARIEGAVRGIDLAVIALAPFALVAASWPWLAAASRGSAAVLLAILAIVYLLAAMWADARRSERDLWRPLSGAAVVFLTAALERALGREHTPMAWCVEGALLTWLGLRERGGWLRTCGYVVTGLGALWVVGTIYAPGAWERRMLPAFYSAGLHDLASILAVLALAWLLGRGRRHLTVEERRAPEIWVAIGNLLLMTWAGREAIHLALTLEGSGGRWAGPQAGQGLNVLSASLMGLVWMTQALVLVAFGRSGRTFPRACGHVVGVFGALVLLVSQSLPDGWSSDRLPVLHPTGMINLVSIGLMAVLATALAGARERLGGNERYMPEIWTTAASLLMLGWVALEADHVARSIEGMPGMWERHAPGASREITVRARVLAASITSAGWLVQAIVLLALGWARRSAFLRWAGLGLAGVTVLKFLAVDLQTVDVFWRFLTAIVVGAALLGVSYAYQQRARKARGVG
jgi:uncharacterized membrane protein